MLGYLTQEIEFRLLFINQIVSVKSVSIRKESYFGTADTVSAGMRCDVLNFIYTDFIYTELVIKTEEYGATGSSE